MSCSECLRKGWDLMHLSPTHDGMLTECCMGFVLGSTIYRGECSSLSSAFTFSLPPLLNCPLILKGDDLDGVFRSEHSVATYPQHASQCCPLAKEASLTRAESRTDLWVETWSLEDSLITWPLSIASLGPLTCPATGSSPGLQFQP